MRMGDVEPKGQRPDWTAAVPGTPAGSEQKPAAETGGDDLPERLRPAKDNGEAADGSAIEASAVPKLEAPTAAEDTLAEGGVEAGAPGLEPLPAADEEAERGKGAEGVPEAWREEFAYYVDTDKNYLERRIKWAEEHKNEGIDAIASGVSKDQSVHMPIDEYIGRIREIIASREVQAAPEAIAFPARVMAARGLVEKAMDRAKALPEMIAEERRLAAEARRRLPELLTVEGGKTGIKTPELSADELEILKEAEMILAFYDNDIGMKTAENRLKRNVLELQEQYKLGRDMAEAANRKYEAELGMAANELKQGWFKKEPAVVREMAQLQAFFDRAGNAEELQREITDIEAAKTNFIWNILNEKQQADVEKKLSQAKDSLAMLESVEGFTGREDMPETLREVIEAAKAGRQFDFGTGPVANFRRKVYESVVDTLGIEAAPAVEVVEAVAPAAPTPEPEPAASVETAEQIRQRAETEFLGEDELDPEVAQAQAILRGSVVSGKANPKAVAEAVANQVKQNPGAQKEAVAGAKQLMMGVLAEARNERDSKKRQKMFTWVKDFGVGLEATSMAGSISLSALDALISAIVNELGGQK